NDCASTGWSSCATTAWTRTTTMRGARPTACGSHGSATRTATFCRCSNTAPDAASAPEGTPQEACEQHREATHLTDDQCGHRQARPTHRMRELIRGVAQRAVHDIARDRADEEHHD